jgi:hypothetical protein
VFAFNSLLLLSGIASPEVVSKRQIVFENKAQADEKAQHTYEYVSILKRSVLHLILKNQMRIPLAGQRSYRTLDGVLKPLLMTLYHIRPFSK